MQTQLYIDGKWCAAAAGTVFPVVNPATEEVLAEVAGAGQADVDAAVQAARRCFESAEWRGMSGRQRGRLLTRAAELLEERGKDFARVESQQNGKTFFEARIEIGMVAQVLHYYGGWADKLHGETLPVEGPYLTYTLREPVGVVGAIVPWNFPLNLASWKFAPALAAGCTVILKPASETPLTALMMAEVFHDAGMPAGAFNVLPGGGREAGGALVRHPGVDKITFTGSTEVGRQVMTMAAETNKPVTLELGGKSPNIIFADADIDAAVKGALAGIFYSKGEVCAAGSRLLVEESIKDEVVAKLAARAKSLTIGDPMEKGTRLGAVVSKGQQETVLGYIAKGLAEGATLVAGGKAASLDGKGWFVEATVFDKVTPDMTIAKEEIFGPVLAVMGFENEEHCIHLANETIYGLAAGIWTRDVGKAHRVAKAIRAGTVWVNAYNAYDPAAPFGGFKASGFGRDLGREALDGFLATKTVWVGLQ